MGGFRYGHASAETWEDALEGCLAGVAAERGDGNLGFVYGTDDMYPHMDDVLGRLRETTGVAHWVGTVGAGICATGTEYYDRPALAAMVVALPEDGFRVFSASSPDLSELQADHAAWLREETPYMGFVHLSPGAGDIGRYVDALAAQVSTGFLVGGLGSSRQGVGQWADGVTNADATGVLFRDTVSVRTRLTQGCSPIGPAREVTEASGNVLVTIEGRPALEVFKGDIGEVLARDMSRLGGYIFAALPNRGSDTSDYRVRNLVGIDPENGLVAIGERVAPGDRVMFCRRDGSSAQEDLRRMLEAIGGDLEGTPRGGVYVSCIGRGANLFGPDSAELKIVEDVLGAFPLVGFYANGELSRDTLYGYTGVLTLFT